MQANLEAIKQKLDELIRLQSMQIIEQRITNGKLGKVLEYSEAIKDYSEATMNNTALAAQQLAYQKAEFWLK